MTQAAEKVLSEAMKLSDAERAQIAGKLLETLDPPGQDLSEAEHAALWEAEIARRIEDLDSGQVKTVAWEDVRSWLREGRDPNEVP